MHSDEESREFWKGVITKRTYDNSDIETGHASLEELKKHREFLTIVLQNLDGVIAKREAEEKTEDYAKQDTVG